MSSSKHLIRSMYAALALTGAAAAHAGAVTFEDPVDSPFFFDGESFTQQGYVFDVLSVAGEGFYSGAFVNGAESCGTLKCPNNNASMYYTSVDAGVLGMRMESGGGFRLTGFDASFLGANGEVLPFGAGLLGIEAHRANGSYVFSTFALAGPDGSGNLKFASFGQGDEVLRKGKGSVFDADFNEFVFIGYTCNATGDCQGFSDNRAQFALDNVMAQAVPEPATWLLTSLGLAAAGLVSRRRMPAKPQAAA